MCCSKSSDAKNILQNYFQTMCIRGIWNTIKLCLDLGPISNISHYIIYVKEPKNENPLQSKTYLPQAFQIRKLQNVLEWGRKAWHCNERDHVRMGSANPRLVSDTAINYLGDLHLSFLGFSYLKQSASAFYWVHGRSWNRNDQFRKTKNNLIFICIIFLLLYFVFILPLK